MILSYYASLRAGVWAGNIWPLDLFFFFFLAKTLSVPKHYCVAGRTVCFGNVSLCCCSLFYYFCLCFSGQMVGIGARPSQPSQQGQTDNLVIVSKCVEW